MRLKVKRCPNCGDHFVLLLDGEIIASHEDPYVLIASLGADG